MARVFGCIVLLLAAATAAQAESIGSVLGADVGGLSPVSIFFLIAAATLVSEDLAAISAGVLAGQGSIGFPLALASAAFGIFIGDILLYLGGRVFGRPALKLPVIRRFVTPDAVERSSHWLERRGMAAIFISRFVVGTRLPLYVAAGILQTSFWKFVLYFSIAVAVWTPLLVGASYFFGARIVADTVSNGWVAALSVGIILAVYFTARLAQRLATRKGRRILAGKIKRRFIWEFWSIKIFYIPVVFKIAALAIRYRSATLFTSANPSMPAGGFVGESKGSILRDIAASEDARPFLLRHRLVGGDDRVADALRFATDFPVVVKPDAGERGFGVRIVKTRDELGEVIGMSSNPMIVQEYAPGEEVSVFYYRFPDSDRGEIFSVTEKRFPEVVGDGRSTLADLILSDPRAVCLAESYLEQNAARLDEIPANGESVRIIDIGTHSRGAVFLDGGHLITPELVDTIDRICRGIDGFFFGRFDIRTASLESFSRGEDFRIVELNGVTSESTNIYDPRYSLFDAYRILFRQWEIAFEIGRRNRAFGIRPATVRELVRMYLKRPR